jgi:hypothetical protein
MISGHEVSRMATRYAMGANARTRVLGIVFLVLPVTACDIPAPGVRPLPGPVSPAHPGAHGNSVQEDQGDPGLPATGAPLVENSVTESARTAVQEPPLEVVWLTISALLFVGVALYRGAVALAKTVVSGIVLAGRVIVAGTLVTVVLFALKSGAPEVYGSCMGWLRALRF